MTASDKKISEVFAGYVVRKDLTKELRGSAIVPSYVLEYLLGQYCATNDEESIKTGIQSVKDIFAEHFVHKNENGLIRAKIRERGSQKVIDKVSVSLNDRDDVYEATFHNLDIKKVVVSPEIVKKHPKLLVNGIWCIAGVSYMATEEKNQSPWILDSLKPIQLSAFDKDFFKETRKQFSTDEWIDLLVQSIGFNPEIFSKRVKLLLLMRLLPFCERNYNLIELGPKGTGKSHIYSEFSPHGILLSGGEVTMAKLFVNNGNGKIGLVGYWDTVAFDEFAGKQKTPDKQLVDIMKNYMANKSFSRGVDTYNAEASMAFVGNTSHNVPFMLKNSDLFEELPKQYHDSAFLDRVHFYIPGWEFDNLREEMFCTGYGFIVDYLAEILRAFRNEDLATSYKSFFTLDSTLSSRDRDGIQKTMSGLMKLIFPNNDATKEETAELLNFAMEGRKRVKDQFMRFDNTFAVSKFQYCDKDDESKVHAVSTTEEREYPELYYRGMPQASCEKTEENPAAPVPDLFNIPQPQPRPVEKKQLPEGNFEYHEGDKGVSYRKLLIPYLRGASEITIEDPYIRSYWQCRNLMDLLTEIVRDKSPEDEVQVKVITVSDMEKCEEQQGYLDKIANAVCTAGITLLVDYESNLHDRTITTDTGWKIILGRGLDIFTQYEGKDTFCLQNTLQEFRPCKGFNITYIRLDKQN